MDFDAHGGVTLAEGDDEVAEGLEDAGEDGDAHGAGEWAARFEDGARGFVEGAEDVLGAAVEGAAGVGDGEAPGGAVDEAHAEALEPPPDGGAGNALSSRLSG